MLSGRTRWPQYFLMAHAACTPSRPFWYASINLKDLIAKLYFDANELSILPGWTIRLELELTVALMTVGQHPVTQRHCIRVQPQMRNGFSVGTGVSHSPNTAQWNWARNDFPCYCHLLLQFSLFSTWNWQPICCEPVSAVPLQGAMSFLSSSLAKSSRRSFIACRTMFHHFVNSSLNFACITISYRDVVQWYTLNMIAEQIFHMGSWRVAINCARYSHDLITLVMWRSSD